MLLFCNFFIKKTVDKVKKKKKNNNNNTHNENAKVLASIISGGDTVFTILAVLEFFG